MAAPTFSSNFSIFLLAWHIEYYGIDQKHNYWLNASHEELTEKTLLYMVLFITFSPSRWCQHILVWQLLKAHLNGWILQHCHKGIHFQVTIKMNKEISSPILNAFSFHQVPPSNGNSTPLPSPSFIRKGRCDLHYVKLMLAKYYMDRIALTNVTPRPYKVWTLSSVI